MYVFTAYFVYDGFTVQILKKDKKKKGINIIFIPKLYNKLIIINLFIQVFAQNQQVTTRFNRKFILWLFVYISISALLS